MPDVLHGILGQARSGPALPAVKDLDADLTYAELCQEAARVGAAMSGRGVVEGDRVALLLPNSVDFVVAALACMWIGAIFVPLSVTDPEIRLVGIVTDCAPALVVAVQPLEGAPSLEPSLGGSPLVTMSTLRTEGDGALEPLEPLEPSERVAYAIYTSGTTGTPKGVLIGGPAFTAAVEATAELMGLDRTTRGLCVSPFYFDGSFATLFPTLFCGGALVIRPRDALLFPRTFFNAVLNERINYTGFSPSYLRLLLADPQLAKLSDSVLDIIALGGEASSLEDIRRLWSVAPHVRVFNRYGPTETTIAVSHEHLTPEVTQDGVVPLGYPHPNVTFYILDEQRQIVDGSGHVGELYIGGAQLMTGYWGAPALTAEVLRDDVVPGEVVYRTGDLVFRDDNGRYVYVDRADRVIKRSGVRISLLEVAEALRALDHVKAAACVAFDAEGELGIVAFVVTDEPITALSLSQAARDRLPDTMLPDRIELVEDLPITQSNKLDERLLLSEAGLRPLRSHTPGSAPPSS